MKKRIGKVNYIVEVGDITKISTDILFLWTVGKLNQGDPIWKKIHRAAGSVLYEDGLMSLTQYGIKDLTGETFLPPSRCIVSRAGFLDVYHIIQCILPNKKVKEENNVKDMFLTRTFQNALMLADTVASAEVPMYKLTFYPISELICGEITEENVKTFWKMILELKNFKEIKMICENEKEYKFYSSILEKMTTPKWERILNKVFKNKF